MDHDITFNGSRLLLMLAGMAIGTGTALWTLWSEEESSAERTRTLLLLLVLPLMAVAFCQPDRFSILKYHGERRWSGLWENPNTYGLLMGTAFVLAAGQLVQDSVFKICGPKTSERTRKYRWTWQTIVSLFGGALLVTGLVNSYSRGAWLGTVCGLGYLIWLWMTHEIRETQESSWARIRETKARNQESGVVGRLSESSGQTAVTEFLSPSAPRCSSYSWCRCNWLASLVLVFSLLVLGFWEIRYVKWPPAQRVFSTANLNDFSWRNRITAWEGGLAMMAERPVLGFGWNQPEPFYRHYYTPLRLEETMAIQMNDYFMLGMALGLPALLCFLAYVWLCLTRNAEWGIRNENTASLLGTGPPSRPPDTGALTSDSWLQATCRAGALVLLIGFAFDGGLFKLALAAPFWILLELGRKDVAPTAERTNTGKLNLPKWMILLLMLSALIAGMIWAKARDAFRRESLPVRTPNGGKTEAIAVVPKSKEPLPVIIFAHGSGGDIVKDGNTLRAFAEQGLAAVSFEYDESNQAHFDTQMRALLDKLLQQKWVRSNAVAWVVHSLGAQRSLHFLFRHPQYEPQVMVRLNGGWVDELGKGSGDTRQESDGKSQGADPSTLISQLSTNLTVWLIHGENDRIFPAQDVRKLAAVLEARGIPVRLDMFPHLGHGFGSDRQEVIRAVAEFCAQQFGTLHPVQVNTRPTLWWYWLPFGVLVIGLGFVALRRPFMDSIKHGNRLLTVVAFSAAALAIADTTINLGVPQMHASARRLDFTRSWLVRPELRNDFDWLTGRTVSANGKISVLLQHLDLAHYNRSLVNWQVDESLYRDFVLSPWIEPDDYDIGWRRMLWEAFYPRIRKENDPQQAAEVVVRFLRERVTITHAAMQHQSIPEIWTSGITDMNGFERIYTAALRSVGIPARLSVKKQAEMWTSSQWQPAPEPFIKIAPSGFNVQNSSMTTPTNGTQHDFHCEIPNSYSGVGSAVVGLFVRHNRSASIASTAFEGVCKFASQSLTMGVATPRIRASSDSLSPFSRRLDRSW